MTTQLFYDNKILQFVEQAKAAGINIAYHSGHQEPFKKLSQLSMVPKTFKVELAGRFGQGGF